MDVDSILERRDKWFLAGGAGVLYAPPFPKHLLAPGYWDECFFGDQKLERLYTVLFVPYSKPVRWESKIVRWRPSHLILEHRSGGTLVRETRALTEGQAWTSTFELLSGEPIQAYLWSLPECREVGKGAPWRSVVDCEARREGLRYAARIRWPRTLNPDRSAVESEASLPLSETMLPGLDLHVALGANSARTGFTVNLAEKHDLSPLWETSVLPGLARRGSLPNEVKFRVGTTMNGLLHLVQGYELGPDRPLVVAAGVGLDSASAWAALEGALESPVEQAMESAARWFGSVPQFTCSDEHLQMAYWYRWYGLRLNAVDIPGLPIAEREASFAPFVAEGIGYFRNFITYSAQSHLREMAWHHDPKWSRGILDNLTRVQRQDGSFPGHNYSARPERDFYHADFAAGASLTEHLHPGSLREEHLQTLQRYLDYLWRERQLPCSCRSRDGEPEGESGLCLVFDQNETGQEYMNRYQWIDSRADEWGRFEVEGVDATTYAEALSDFLASCGGHPAPFQVSRLWNPAAGWFCDRHQGRFSPARPSTGFYPLGLPHLPMDATQAALLCEVLMDPTRFWLPAGFPAESMAEPTFSARPEWKRKRTNCPWNGRSWPMVNSHLVDGMANVARQLLPELRLAAALALVKSVKLLFHDGDPARPCCYEHYDPVEGTPCLYRGYDDYMHGWLADLVLRHVVGVVPDGSRAGRNAFELPGGFALDPLPVGVECECSQIPHPEGKLAVQVGRTGAAWSLVEKATASR